MSLRQRLHAMSYAPVLFAAASISPCAATGQATGDSRHLVEPRFPPSCVVLRAAQRIVVDAPASETAYDTERIQTALNACTPGHAVELAGGKGMYAFLSAGLTIPSGVGLIVDGGVTLYASRRAADYQIPAAEPCGVIGTDGGCRFFLSFPEGSEASGLYGYGVIDLRGYATILDKDGKDTGISWWKNADLAAAAKKRQNNLPFMRPSHARNLTVYKITIRNGPFIHVAVSAVQGLTAWGVKVQAPFSARETDGIDPWGSDATIAYSSISVGDDAVAIDAATSTPTKNISVLHTRVYSSQGVSIGSYTRAGVSNVLVKDVNFAGDPNDRNEAALRIKSAPDRGGIVQNVTYEDVCMKDIVRLFRTDPFFSAHFEGALIPTFRNILLHNVHGLTPSPGVSTYVTVRGADAEHPSSVRFDNVVFDRLDNTEPAWQYASVALAGNVYPQRLQQQSGKGISYSGSASHNNKDAYDCSKTNEVFPPLSGEIYLSTASETNLQSVTATAGTHIALHAVVQPARSQISYDGDLGSSAGAPALKRGVEFYEGKELVGRAELAQDGANSSFATFDLPKLAVGTHSFTVRYPGDKNYPETSFGPVTVEVR